MYQLLQVQTLMILQSYSYYQNSQESSTQIDVKSGFLYGRIKEKAYVCQPLWFEDPDHLNKVYKVVKALYGLHQAPRACTPVDMEMTLVKDADGDDVDVHLYKSMIGSLMYLTASRPDIIAKTIALNEFSITMAFAIICLATNQKFNFLKYIFDHMVNNMEDGVKFLMFPRFVETFLDSQVEGMLKHKGIYVTPSQTKKSFANMKRHGKDFSGKVTPLFETMMVQPQEDIGKDSEIPTDSHYTPIVTQPSTSSQLKQKQKSKKSKKRIIEVTQPSDSTHDVEDEHMTTTSNDPLLSGSSTRVKSFKDAGLGDQEDASKQGRMIDDLNADEGVTLVDVQDMFDTSILEYEEVVTKKEVSTVDPAPNAGEVVTTAGVEAKDKGKAKMIEPEKPLKRKDQIMIDEEVIRNLEAHMQDELEKEERLANYELAARLQEEKRGELTIEEKSSLFMELMDKRKKYFARLRAKKIIKLVKGSEKAAEGSSKEQEKR
nr:ribonuclease H-like domain, reverse transcriptase, RNA-dependent DNA polymerase [Tanacetum cinerariifolium]